jgi:hypothetical protein
MANPSGGQVVAGSASISTAPGTVTINQASSAAVINWQSFSIAAGNLYFTGNSDAGVTNLGRISALGGDVILIGKTVDNQGGIAAANGHVGLVAADDVLVTQSGLEHVFVRSVAEAASARPG